MTSDFFDVPAAIDTEKRDSHWASELVTAVVCMPVCHWEPVRTLRQMATNRELVVHNAGVYKPFSREAGGGYRNGGRVGLFAAAGFRAVPRFQFRPAHGIIVVG